MPSVPRKEERRETGTLAVETAQAKAERWEHSARPTPHHVLDHRAPRVQIHFTVRRLPLGHTMGKRLWQELESSSLIPNGKAFPWPEAPH